MKKLWLLPVLATYFLLCHACYGVILLNDTWADGTRDDTNLPDESAVWAGDDADVTVSVGSLQYGHTAYTDSHKLWTYFTPDGSPQSVNMGDKLIATIEFIPRGLYVSDAENFRMGLYTDPTDSQVHEDTDDDGGGDTDPWTDSTGYGVRVPLSSGSGDNPQVGKRVDMNNNSLLGSSGAYSWDSGGDNVENMTDQTLHTAIFELDYSSGDQMVVTFTLKDAGGNVITSHSLTDDGTNHLDPLSNPTPIYTKFDHLFFRFSAASGTADIIDFQNFKVEYIPLAESLTWASDPDPADDEIKVAIDLSDRTIPNNLSWIPPIDPNIAEIKGYDLYLDPNDVKVSSRDAGCQIVASIAGGVTQYDPASDFNYNETLYWIVDTDYVRDDDPNLGTPNEDILVGSPYVPWNFTTITASPVIETYDSVVTTMDLLPAALSAVVTDGDDNVSSAAFAVTSSPAGSTYILDEDVSDPYAPSATLDPNMPGTYEVKLTVTDDDTNTDEATAQIEVYDDACAAAQAAASWDGFNDMDFDTDCDVDLVDLAAFAEQWLDDRNLKEQGILAP